MQTELVFENVTKAPFALNDTNEIHDCKKWRDYEVEAIAKIYAQLPREFRENALDAAGGPIIFVRAGKKDSGAYASARFNTVCIYDSGIDKWEKLGDQYLMRIVAHELTHVIDFAQRYSFSVEWMNLLHPHILKFTQQTKNVESDNEKNQESIKLGFAQIPDDYTEVMCCLNGSLIARDDYYTVAPNLKSFLTKKFLTRNKLTATNKKQREIALTNAKLTETGNPNYAAADRLMAQNDSPEWFFPIEVRREHGLHRTHNNLETYNVAQTELERLTKLGFDDSDLFKNTVLLTLGRLACRLNHVEAGKSYFARACSNGDKLVAAYNEITPYENYQTVLAFSKLFWEMAPDKIPDYFAEANAHIQAGNVDEAIEALQKSQNYLTKNKKDEKIANSLAAERAALLFDLGKISDAQSEILKWCNTTLRTKDRNLGS